MRRGLLPGLTLILLSTGCIDVPGRPTVTMDAADGSSSDARPDHHPDARTTAADPCAACDDDALCVAGRCADCDPATHQGCAADGPTPTCDPESLSCVGCAADADCRGRHCLPGGRCAECDPADHRGCGLPERPICDVDGTCRACAADAECVAAGRAPICDIEAGVCRICLDGIGRGCDPTGGAPICEAERCRACAGAECGPGLDCRDGRCEGCNPIDNSGCDPDGDAPICVNGDCEACQLDGQCLDPARGFCVDGRCRACDPATHAGCDPAGGLPLCDAGACVGCGAGVGCADRDPARPLCLSDGRCGICDPADDAACAADEAGPICDDAALICRACRDDADCAPGFCDPAAGGRCVPCVQGTITGCDLASDAPICGLDWLCRACDGHDECAESRRGTRCRRGGTCGCDRDDHCAESSRGRHCHGNLCLCHDDDDCPPGRTCNDAERCVLP